MSANIFTELKWRGLLEQVSDPELEKILGEEQLTCAVVVDDVQRQADVCVEGRHGPSPGEGETAVGVEREGAGAMIGSGVET